jgi:hypothetical protein
MLGGSMRKAWPAGFLAPLLILLAVAGPVFSHDSREERAREKACEELSKD